MRKSELIKKLEAIEGDPIIIRRVGSVGLAERVEECSVDYQIYNITKVEDLEITYMLLTQPGDEIVQGIMLSN